MIKMVTLRKEDIPCLRNLLNKRAEEANLTARFSADTYMEFVMHCYDRKMMGAYVDDLLDPKVCLILLHTSDTFSDNTIVHVCLTYVDPTLRGDMSLFSDLETYTENYAKLIGANQIIASAWTYQGARSIAALWKRHGFEEQEVKFIKFLDK